MSRLEDQRGTEINFELPDFLKNKENFTNNNKLRKTKTNEPVPLARSQLETHSLKPITPLTRPQPAPRLSIAKSPTTTVQLRFPELDNSTINKSVTKQQLSPTLEHADTKMLFNHNSQQHTNSMSSSCNGDTNGNNGALNSSFISTSTVNSNFDDYYADSASLGGDPLNPRGPPPLPPKPKILPIKPSNWGQTPPGKGPIESPRSHSAEKNAYLDQATSSFV